MKTASRIRHLRVALLAILSAATIGCGPQDLGTLGGLESIATATNNHGWVVGRAQTSNGDWHAFLHIDGTMQDLGTLGGSYSTATDVNDAGEIVGWSTTSGGRERAFVWRNGQMSGFLPPGDVPNQRAYGISENGTIVGAIWYPDSRALPAMVIDGEFKFIPGTLTYLYFLHGFAADANDQLVVGTSYDFGAWYWGGSGAPSGLAPIPPPHDDGRASAVNSFNNIVGRVKFNVGGQYQPESAVWFQSFQPPVPLIPVGERSAATDVADDSLVVGWTEPVPDSVTPFFRRFGQGSPAEHLPTLGGPHGAALGVNNNANIVGWSENQNGHRRATRWLRPRTND